MTDYKIAIKPFKQIDGIQVWIGREDACETCLSFGSVADLDHFIYELRQASFDYKVSRSKQKPYEPRRGC